MSAEDILRIDLQGVQVLVPHIIKALEITLPVPEKELILGYENWIISFYRIGEPINYLSLHFMHIQHMK